MGDMKSWEYRTISFEQRVAMHVVPDSVTGCHNFTGRKDSDGYGQIKDKGKAVSVHRWVWAKINGPTKAHILHKCDNPACVNAEHLYAGTHAQNMRDKAVRGRSGNVPKGREHKRPMAKVTEDQVIAIKVGLAAKRSQASLARRFGVSRNLISEIFLEKTWKHLNIRVH